MAPKEERVLKVRLWTPLVYLICYWPQEGPRISISGFWMTEFWSVPPRPVSSNHFTWAAAFRNAMYLDETWGNKGSRTALKYVQFPPTNWYEPVLMSSARKRKAPQIRRNPSLGGDQGVSKVRAKIDRSGGQWCDPSTYFENSDWLGMYQ